VTGLDLSSVPSVTVVIRALNEAASIESVLTDVLAQEGVGRLEVLVIDSGSTDPTPEIVLGFPRENVRLERLDPARFTFGGALNLGGRLARSPVCVHLSAHCRPMDRHWLARLVSPLADPRCVATFGRQLPIRGLNPFEEIELHRIFPPGPLADGARRYFSNANCAIRRDALNARPFDESIPIMEDTLWLLELGPNERVSYVPEAAVFHSHPLRLAYWYRRFRKDGHAYRYIAARCGVDLLSQRALGPAGRLRDLLDELVRVSTRLAASGYWRHLALYPLYCVIRELALRRGLRDGLAQTTRLSRTHGPLSLS
jgi:glycosyltransferase involved in cell wall biosynthesis